MIPISPRSLSRMPMDAGTPAPAGRPADEPPGDPHGPTPLAAAGGAYPGDVVTVIQVEPDEIDEARDAAFATADAVHGMLSEFLELAGPRLDTQRAAAIGEYLDHDELDVAFGIVAAAISTGSGPWSERELALAGRVAQLYGYAPPMPPARAESKSAQDSKQAVTGAGAWAPPHAELVQAAPPGVDEEAPVFDAPDAPAEAAPAPAGRLSPDPAAGPSGPERPQPRRDSKSAQDPRAD